MATKQFFLDNMIKRGFVASVDLWVFRNFHFSLKISTVTDYSHLHAALSLFTTEFTALEPYVGTGYVRRFK